MGILDFLFTDPAKLQLPSPADALPGRVEPILAPGRHTVLGTPIDGPWPAGTRTVTFAMGCFWGAEKGFWTVPGVVTTAVGYAGGVTPNPTYEEVCSGRTGHAEVVRVAYDPERVSFESLLRLFWEAHDPTQGMRQGNDRGTQYRSAIYVADADELARAEASRAMYQEHLSAAGYGPDHDRDRARGSVLLRRGVPPAIPRQEPERLLPRPRDGRGMPDRARRDRAGTDRIAPPPRRMGAWDRPSSCGVSWP